MEKIILIGGGGHCISVIDSIIKKNEYKIVGIIDKVNNIGNKVLGIDIIGSDDDLLNIYMNGIKKAVITIGSVGDTDIRKKIYSKLKSIGYELPIIIDESSIISEFTDIGEGTYIGKNSIINSSTIIGKCCILNTSSVIEHNCDIGDFVHLAPRSILCGHVKVGNNTHVGANSVVVQEVNIGEKSIIGAGSTVIKDIKSNSIAYGNPCIVVKKR